MTVVPKHGQVARGMGRETCNVNRSIPELGAWRGTTRTKVDKKNSPRTWRKKTWSALWTRAQKTGILDLQSWTRMQGMRVDLGVKDIKMAIHFHWRRMVY